MGALTKRPAPSFRLDHFPAPAGYCDDLRGIDGFVWAGTSQSPRRVSWHSRTEVSLEAIPLDPP
jgi:hypothetical protein